MADCSHPWIQWDMFYSGKLKLDDFIGTRNRIFSGKPKLDGFIGTEYGYNGIGFFV